MVDIGLDQAKKLRDALANAENDLRYLFTACAIEEDIKEDEVMFRHKLAVDFLTLLRADAARMVTEWQKMGRT